VIPHDIQHCCLTGPVLQARFLFEELWINRKYLLKNAEIAFITIPNLKVFPFSLMPNVRRACRKISRKTGWGDNGDHD